MQPAPARDRRVRAFLDALAKLIANRVLKERRTEASTNKERPGGRNRRAKKGTQKWDITGSPGD